MTSSQEAPRALATGLVSAVVPDDQLEEAAMAIENRNQVMCSGSQEFRDRMKAFVKGER